MTNIPAPDEQTQYTSRRHDDVDALAFPLSQHALDLTRSPVRCCVRRPAS